MPDISRLAYRGYCKHILVLDTSSVIGEGAVCNMSAPVDTSILPLGDSDLPSGISRVVHHTALQNAAWVPENNT